MNDVGQRDQVSERLDRIERTCEQLARQNRWLKVCVAVLPLVTLLAGAASQTRDLDARTVTTERLVINDGQGRKRAAIECKEKRASFEMYDPAGARRIGLHVMDNGFASIYQHYGDGKMASFGWVTPSDGNRTPASFALRGPDATVYATLTGKTATSPPSFEIFAGEKGRNPSLGRLGGASQ